KRKDVIPYAFKVISLIGVKHMSPVLCLRVVFPKDTRGRMCEVVVEQLDERGRRQYGGNFMSQPLFSMMGCPSRTCYNGGCQYISVYWSEVGMSCPTSCRTITVVKESIEKIEDEKGKTNNRTKGTPAKKKAK
ncbi:hypothetical protein HAX54_044743, partial [Datura stramonium]|nr:hypothetical protein [Datura stramonium]